MVGFKDLVVDGLDESPMGKVIYGPHNGFVFVCFLKR